MPKNKPDEWSPEAERMASNVGRVIVEIRSKERGSMAQRELARRSGLTQSYLSVIEHGNANMTMPTLLKICEALQVSVAEVLLRAEFIDRELTGTERGFVSFTLGILQDLYTARHDQPASA